MVDLVSDHMVLALVSSALYTLVMSSPVPDPAGVFVYGTLRPGGSNATLWQGCGQVRHRHAIGVDLAVGEPWHGRFPYAWREAGSRVHGEFLDLADDQDWLLDRLDQLEGYRPDYREASHYLRDVIEVLVAGSPLRAWTYLAGPSVDLEGLDPVVGGDWTG